VPVVFPDTVAVVVVVRVVVIVVVGLVGVVVDFGVVFVTVEQADASMIASIKIRHVVIRNRVFFFILNLQ
jgi:hypothetical protein